MKYLVGLSVGGIQGDPVQRIEDVVVIVASSRKEAEDIYNEKYKCTYYYATALASEDEVFNESVTVAQLRELRAWEMPVPPPKPNDPLEAYDVRIENGKVVFRATGN